MAELHARLFTTKVGGPLQRVVMQWLGYQESSMIRHYYHLHDEESRRRMDQLDFLGKSGGRSTSVLRLEA